MTKIAGWVAQEARALVMQATAQVQAARAEARIVVNEAQEAYKAEYDAGTAAMRAAKATRTALAAHACTEEIERAEATQARAENLLYAAFVASNNAEKRLEKAEREAKKADEELVRAKKEV